jgi:hypothetical protein
MERSSALASTLFGESNKGALTLRLNRIALLGRVWAAGGSRR